MFQRLITIFNKTGYTVIFAIDTDIDIDKYIFKEIAKCP